MLVQACCNMQGLCPCSFAIYLITHRKGNDDSATLCFRSLLSNLRKLTLHNAVVPLPALQPVATRLHNLQLKSSRLEGSSDGFLTSGWTALTSLHLQETRMENATLTAALKIPALERLCVCGFFWRQGGELQLDQLTGCCPRVSRLVFKPGRSLVQAS